MHILNLHQMCSKNARYMNADKQSNVNPQVQSLEEYVLFLLGQ